MKKVKKSPPSGRLLIQKGILAATGLLLAVYVLATVEFSIDPSKAPKTPASPPPSQRSPDEPKPKTHTRTLPSTELAVVLNEYSHDANAFTQGLEFDGDDLYESTGLNGHSTIRRVNLSTGQVETMVRIDNQHFGEGLTIFNNQIFLLTWQSKLALVYNMYLKLQQTFPFPYEGWGLTHNQEHLIASDGSDKIRFLSPLTMEVERTINVRERLATDREKYASVRMLNELEWIDGFIYANVWMTTRIAVINSQSGLIHKWIEAGHIYRPRPGEDVLNGIAYHASSRKLFVTGKKWPKLFEIAVNFDYSPI